VESAEALQGRVTSFIAMLDEQFARQKILLVSHGDALQVLQTGFEKVAPSYHRELPHLNTAEIRELHLKV
jgi:probable phosphoglycerate mutase